MKTVLLFSLITEVSMWYLPLCVVAGFVYSFLFYFKDNTFRECSALLRWLMAAFRFVSVTVISLLLLSPFVRSNDIKVEKPVLVIAQDNSESLMMNDDSSVYKTTYAESMRELVSRLRETYTVKTLSFGSSLHDSLLFDYSDKSTSFDELFEQVANRYSNRNLGAIIVASDGLFNQGSSPEAAAEQHRIKCPIYALALGDTVPPRDARVSSLKFNQLGFENYTLPVIIQVDASELEGKNIAITVSEGSKVLFTKELKATNRLFFSTVSLSLPPTSTGIHHYKVDLTRFEGEISHKNNSRTFAIEVLKSKQRFLVVSNSPHPDIAALSRGFETNANYKADFTTTAEFKGKLEEYNLLIMHQLPSANNACTAMLEEAASHSLPVLFIGGTQTDMTKMNSLFPGINRGSRFSSFDESQMTFNESFPLFEIDDETRQFIEQCPPLFVPYASYELGNVHTLAYQRINSIETKRPLVFFTAGGEWKRAVIAGEGLWRWRMTNIRKQGDAKLFDALMAKIMAYMAMKDLRTKFRIKNNKVFSESQAVEFEAELYNDSYEMVNTPEVSMTITDAEGKTHQYMFSKTDKAYGLNAGLYPVGDYRYKAQVQAQETSLKHEFSGQFTVVPINVESENVVADHRMLFSLATNNSGKMFFPSRIDSLVMALRANDNITAISHSDNVLRELIDLPALFFFILLLLSVEWFVRKYAGGR